MRQQAGIDEGEVHRFQVVARDHLAAQVGLLDAALGRCRDPGRPARQRGRHAVVAVDTGDLFDQVFLDRQVEAAAGRRGLPAVGGVFHPHVQRTQDAADLGVRDGHTEHPRQALAAQDDRPRLRQVFGQHGLGDRAGAAAGHLHDQAGGGLDGGARKLRIHAALEAVPGIGMQAQPAAAADDGGRREMRGLQEHVAGSVGHPGVVTAHHPAQRNHAAGIGDGQELPVQIHLAAVQQHQLLAGAGAAHADRALQQVAVKGVHRLAQLQHHVLGHIDQEAHRADARAAQALGHPHRGGRAGVHALDDPAEVARRVGACVQLHLQRGVGLRRHRLGIEPGHFTTKDRGHVPGQPAHAQAVGAVGGQAQFDHVVRQAQVVGQRRPHRRIVRQLHQPGRIGVHAQLFGRAQHAAGFHPAQLRGLDLDVAQLRADHRQRRHQARARVGRAAHDLQRLALPRIHPAHLQAVGLGVLLAGHDLRHHHAVQAAAEALDPFDLQADHRQPPLQLLAGGVDGDVLAQPVFGELHANCPRKRTSLSKNARRSVTP